MQIYSIETGLFKLDGGAMFGVVPQVIWKKLNPPDSKNLCTWAMRCMLVETENRLVLIDTGIGDKQSAKFFSYYEPHGDDTLEKSLNSKGFSLDDITDVVLTHLHFDHSGGAVKVISDDKLETTFKNATYWSNKAHWEHAMNPNRREKASFLKENFVPIKENGQLQFLEDEQGFLEGFKVKTVNGHTESMIIPHIEYKGRTIVYMADLLPSTAHIPIPYVMAYDINPLESMKEKEQFLKTAYENDYILFFEHDKNNECCTLKMTDRGIRPDEIFKLSEL